MYYSVLTFSFFFFLISMATPSWLKYGKERETLIISEEVSCQSGIKRKPFAHKDPVKWCGVNCKDRHGPKIATVSYSNLSFLSPSVFKIWTTWSQKKKKKKGSNLKTWVVLCVHMVHRENNKMQYKKGWPQWLTFCKLQSWGF